jgi:FMN phosphatase YigB (HAD superfamily)
MINAVLFDFSGTLANCGERWWQLELTTTVHAPLALLHERGVVALDDVTLARADDLYADLKRVAKESGVEISAFEAARQAAATLHVGVPDAALEAAVDELFAACLGDVTPLDGAGDVLAELAHSGLALAVISNARHGPFVRWALQRLDLAHFFRSIIVSADVRLRKPRPEIYWNTLRDLGVSPANAAYVGDYYPYDMVGARAAGLRSVWLIEPGKPHDDLPADAVISSLRHLPEALDALSCQ